MEQARRILVPADGSVASDAAAELAGELARTAGASLDLLHVSYFASDTDDGGISWLPAEVTAPTAPRTDAALKRAKSRVPHGVPYRVYTATGVPAEEIVRFAQEHGEWLIVMGSRRLDALHAAILGSVSSHVLKESPCPVVVVKNRAGKKKAY